MQTMFLVRILPTITAQFARTSNDFQQIFLSRKEFHRPLFQMVFDTAPTPVFPIQLVAYYCPLLHLKIAPPAVVARSGSGRGRLCTCTLIKRVATFLQKRLYRSAFKCVYQEDKFWKNFVSLCIDSWILVLINKGWNDMFFACEVWCIADVSSVSSVQATKSSFTNNSDFVERWLVGEYTHIISEACIVC